VNKPKMASASTPQRIFADVGNIIKVLSASHEPSHSHSSICVAEMLLLLLLLLLLFTDLFTRTRNNTTPSRSFDCSHTS
jgi:protein-S-isoprenylcysteine O-methyltransferase Ste14